MEVYSVMQFENNLNPDAGERLTIQGSGGSYGNGKWGRGFGLNNARYGIQDAEVGFKIPFGNIDWTIEMWFCCHTQVTGYEFYATYGSPGVVQYNSSNPDYFDTRGAQGCGYWIMSSKQVQWVGGSLGITMNPGTWYHIAYVYIASKSTIYGYWNGVQKGSTLVRSNYSMIKNSCFWFLPCQGANSIGNNIYKMPAECGTIDQLIVTKGAKYTSNFTPSNSQFVARSAYSKKLYCLYNGTTVGHTLWLNKQTTPSINVQVDGKTVYGDLVAVGSSGAGRIHVISGGKEYVLKT